MEWVIGIVSGLITGTMTCAVFYWLGGKDLKREAEDLRRLNILTIRALHHAGLAEINFDAAGKPVGLVFSFRSSGGIRASGTSIVTVERNVAADGLISLGEAALVEVVRKDDSLRPTDL